MGSNIPKIGASDIAGCYIGDTEIEKIYLGSNIIYEKSVTPTVNGMSIDLNKSYIKIDGSLIQDITENT